MKNKLLFTLALSLFALSYAACNRCHDQYFYLTQSQKDFANFKKGSYWIMRDSATGLLDSFVVSRDTNIGILPTSNEKCRDLVEIEFIDMDIYHGHQPNGDSFFVGFSFRGGDKEQVLYMDSRTRARVVMLPPGLPNTGNDLLLNGTLYHNTHFVWEDFAGDATHVPWKLSLIYNNEYKMLKLSCRDPLGTFVWELVRANIIKP